MAGSALWPTKQVCLWPSLNCVGSSSTVSPEQAPQPPSGRLSSWGLDWGPPFPWSRPQTPRDIVMGISFNLHLTLRSTDCLREGITREVSRPCADNSTRAGDRRGSRC